MCDERCGVTDSGETVWDGVDGKVKGFVLFLIVSSARCRLSANVDASMDRVLLIGTSEAAAEAGMDGKEESKMKEGE
jgi:hypothetical protein